MGHTHTLSLSLFLRLPFLFCVVGNVASANPDVVIANQTEYRFPETHPGKVFTVRKVILNGEGALGKPSLQESQPRPSETLKTPEGISRDVLGRTIRERGYHSKLAQIRARHSLPTYARLETPRIATAGTFKPVRRFSNTQFNPASRIAILSDSPLIQSSADLARMESEEYKAVRRKHGSLSQELRNKLEQMAEVDSVDVLVSLVSEHPGFVDPARMMPAEQKSHAQQWARAKPLVRKDDMTRRYGLREKHPLRTGLSAQNFVTKTTKADVLRMKFDPEIATIQESHEPDLSTVPGSHPPGWLDLVPSAQNPSSSMINLGIGNVATLEVGLTDAFVSRIPSNLQPTYYHRYDTQVGGDSSHSHGMYYLLAGAATGERYHFANGWYGPYGGILDTLIYYDIHAISQSYVGHWYTPLAADSRFVDRMAYLYPFTTVVMPTHNYGHDFVPYNQPYNALSVGNVQHYDLATYNVDFWVWYNGSVVKAADWPNGKATQTKNPDPYYGSIADREMPYLVAPGWTPDPYWGLLDTVAQLVATGGTSLSAPIVAALAGNLRGAVGYGWEQSLIARAALLLTAENVDGGYWDPYSEDQRDGAGTVSGANAVRFVTGNGSYGLSYNPGPDNSGDPQIAAIDVEYLDSALFGTSQYFYYKTPSSLPSGKHLRVVLTWNSSPGVNVAENAISDLALGVQTSGGWYVADTWNGNIEIIDIPSGDLAPNTTYQIRVDPVTFRKASDGPDFTYYALAWDWVKDHAD